VFSGDKKLWPIYMTIGNISSTVRNKPSYHAWIPLAFLPKEPLRVEYDSRMTIKQQALEAKQLYHDVIAGILSPLADRNGLTGYEWFCSDEKIRRCYPVISAWLADHEENALIHCIKNNLCPTCTCPNNKLGDWANDDTQNVYPKRDSIKYHQLLSQLQKPTEKALDALGIKRVKSVLWKLPFIKGHEVVRADLLHNIYLGILKHLMTWIVAFLKKYGRLDRFNHIWENLSHYPGFLKPTTGYAQISQWQGKEMRNFGKVILGCLAAALYTDESSRIADSNRTRAGGNSHRADVQHSHTDILFDLPIGDIHTDQETSQKFDQAIDCVAALIDFHLMAQYRSHNQHTIGYLEEYLKKFHEQKHVFLVFRAGKVAKRKARANEQPKGEELATVQNDPSAGESLRAGYKRLRADKTGSRADANANITNADLEQQAHFNFPKMHLLLHYMEQIKEYGELVQYSTEVSESMHATFKDAYRRSNHNDAAQQIIETYTRKHLFDMHERNLTEWHMEKNLGEEIIQVLCRTHGVGDHSTRAKRRRKELAVLQTEGTVKHPQSSYSNEIKILMQGKLASTTINSLHDLCHNYKLDTVFEDTWAYFLKEYPLAYANGYRAGEVPIHLPADRTRLRTYALDAFNTLSLPVVDFSDETKFQEHKMRATGNMGLRKKGDRADWVWIRVSENPDEAGTLFGRNVARLNAIFKLRGPLKAWRLAHVTFTEGVNNEFGPVGNEQMTRVYMPDATPRSAVVNITNIMGMVHMIPIAKNKFIVNDRIDLTTWNDLS